MVTTRIALACVSVVFLTGAIAAERPAKTLLPRPKMVERTGDGGTFVAAESSTFSVVAANDAPAIELAVDELVRTIDPAENADVRAGSLDEAIDTAGPIIWVGTADAAQQMQDIVAGAEIELPESADVADGYTIDCIEVSTDRIIACVGHDDRAAYYAAQTLKQMLRTEEGDRVTMPAVRVVDWPTFRLRLVKVSAVHSDPDLAIDYAESLPHYKINLYGLQYHRETEGSWRQPSDKYRKVMEGAGRRAQVGGVIEPAAFLCPYFPPRLDATNREDMKAYLQRLRWALDLGFKWIEIDFNDWAKWEQLCEAEREQFDGVGDYMAHVTNYVYDQLRDDYPDVGVIMCPMVGWYHGGARDGLARLCRNIPRDILVYWTGPQVRSRSISKQHITNWTQKTGRKPFLWDNTIYAHFQPYWVGYAFNPYLNAFPEDLPKLLAGPGIHLNASARPHYLPGIMTFADYLWNPEGYDPERSLRNALRLWLGETAPERAAAVRESFIAIHRLLYEAEHGWCEFEREQAMERVDKLQQAVDGLAELTESQKLQRFLERSFVEDARSAVKGFEAPEVTEPQSPVVERPISDGPVNPSAEKMEDGIPVGWSYYHGAGKGTLTVTSDAADGAHSVCLQATEWYHNPDHVRHGDRKWINIAIIHGSELGGYDGHDAYDVNPNKTYKCSFYLKGDVPEVSVEFQGWNLGLTAANRHSLKSQMSVIEPTEQWQRYETTFRTRFDTKKMALKLIINGYRNEGMKLGRICVDDISITEVE